MARIFGIDFAPATIPFGRRLQTLAVLFYTLSFFSPILMVILFVLFLLSPLFWAAIGYGAWILYDAHVTRTSSRGGRRWEWLRHSAIWRYFRDYFPANLVKTADLNPDKNYLIGYHPHGIIGCGAFCSFASEANGFSQKFPGIKPHLLTLKANFVWPLLRAYLLWMGSCDVSGESIRWILSKQGSGNAAIIVVGGAEEALNAHPGRYVLTLKRRKGFIKQAIRVGASLVPAFGFGENDIFGQVDNPEGSWIRAFQSRVKKFTGVSPPIYYGRGVFNYTIGILPHRKPISIVVGRPIDVPRVEDPDQEVIDRIHSQYIDELSRLFDEHKTKYGINENKTLSFV